MRLRARHYRRAVHLLLARVGRNHRLPKGPEAIEISQAPDGAWVDTHVWLATHEARLLLEDGTPPAVDPDQWADMTAEAVSLQTEWIGKRGRARGLRRLATLLEQQASRLEKEA
ncbi:MAG: hypothetical protein GY716_16105 [bacterium]|nr:hypothetical protein [bacterium]